MFRRKSLQRASQPDALDALFVVVTPRSVVGIAALCAVAIIVLAWSILGSIPVKVSGSGILIRPGFIVPLQSAGEGRASGLLVAPGERVSAGQPIVALSRPDALRELDRLNTEFDLTQDFNRRTEQLALASRNLELDLVQQDRARTESRLSELRDLAIRLQQAHEKATREREQKLGYMEGLLQRQRDEQQERLDALTSLQERGLTSRQAELAALAAVTSSEIEAARIEIQIAEVSEDEVTQVRQELDLSLQIKDSETELTRIDIRERDAQRTFDELQRSHQRTLAELAGQIRAARRDVARNRAVRSAYSGTILEVDTLDSELVSLGSTVAVMHLLPQQPFFRVALDRDAGQGSFRLGAGGQVTQPLAADATPSEIHAALLALEALSHLTLGAPILQEDLRAVDIPVQAGDIGAVTDLDLLDVDLWTQDGRPATGTLTQWGTFAGESDMEHVGFFSIETGKQVRPGMEVRIDPVSIEASRFGSLLGHVTTVSDFAVSEAGLKHLVGNTSVIRDISAPGAVLVVEAALIPDDTNVTGFAWSSRVPEVAITEGTTTVVQVVVDHRRPISFVIPLLRSWALGEDGP